MRKNGLLLYVVLIFFAISPFVGFVVLKFNGLDDISGRNQQTANNECQLEIVLGQYRKEIHTNGYACGLIYCESEVVDLRNCFVDLEEWFELRGGNDQRARSSVRTFFDEKHRSSDETREIVEYVQQTQYGVQIPSEAEEEKEIKNETLNLEPKENTDANQYTPNWFEEYIDNLRSSQYGYPFWQWGSIFSISVTFCMFGFLSNRVLQSKFNGYQSSFANAHMLFLFNVISGLLVVVLFAGGFVQGTLFPKFEGDEENFGFNSWVALKFRGG